LKIGESGMLNPTTTKELGNISGVEALTLGTITIIGDTVRITARLVATDTAQTVSAAAVSVPKTEAVSKLLAQPIAGGPGCGMFAAKGAKGDSGLGGQQDLAAGVSGQPPLASQSGNRFSSGGLDFVVQSISRTKDGKTVNLVLGLTATEEKPIKALFLGSQASLLDSEGNQAFAQSVTGLQVCYNGRTWNNDLNSCWHYRQDELTILSPRVSQTVLIRFAAEGADEKDGPTITGDMVSFSSRLGIQKQGEKDPSAISISIPNIPLKPHKAEGSGGASAAL
jgi:hypothetical protein